MVLLSQKSSLSIFFYGSCSWCYYLKSLHRTQCHLGFLIYQHPRILQFHILHNFMFQFALYKIKTATFAFFLLVLVWDIFLHLFLIYMCFIFQPPKFFFTQGSCFLTGNIINLNPFPLLAHQLMRSNIKNRITASQVSHIMISFYLTICNGQYFVLRLDVLKIFYGCFQ